MTIEEYKEAIIGLVKAMEKEHGCDVYSMEMETSINKLQAPYLTDKEYDLKLIIV